MDELFAWVKENRAVVAWGQVIAVVTFFGSLILLPILIARIPHDYFATREPPPSPWQGYPPALRLVFHGVKNVIGGVLVLLGFAMLVLPGQGILTILIGVTLLDFPGKRRLELWAVRRRRVLGALNWIRRRAARPPLEVLDDER